MDTWDRTVRDPSRAAEIMRRDFPRLSLDADSDGRFELRHSGVVDPCWSLRRLRVRGSVTMRGSVSDVYGVGRRVEGAASLSYRRHPVDMTSPYLRPVGQSDLTLKDASLELLALEPLALQRNARRYLMGTRARLVAPSPVATAPLDAATERLWLSTQRYVREVVEDPAVLAIPLIRDHVYDVMVRAFLRSFAVLETGPSSPSPRSGAPTAAITRALEHMDEHPTESITIADLAILARVSVRTLQTGIRRHTGLTATHYLRSRRLLGVRDALLAADPATTTVAGVARDWGFTHLSRFSRDYFDQFGEHPRDSLRT